MIYLRTELQAPVVCHGLFALPRGVIGRLCSVIMALPEQLLYYFELFCRLSANCNKGDNFLLSICVIVHESTYIKLERTAVLATVGVRGTLGRDDEVEG